MLELRNISKRFPGFYLDRISLMVQEGEYFMLLGDSGAGKSLLLEIIAGLTYPDSGTIIMNGADITGRKIQDRSIGLVFQDYAIFPHMSIFDNIAYPLHGSGLSTVERKTRVTSLAEKMGIVHLLHRRPGTLSGGELQRAALARTLAQEPKILLLDEPLSSLDPRLRTGLRSLLRQIHREGQTIIHVTHDYEEALALSDTVAIINNGKIIQNGPPAEVFRHPKSEFVAHFTGIRNFFRVSLVTDHGALFAKVNENLRFRILHENLTGTGHILFRGEEVILSNEELHSSITNTFKGTVREIVNSQSGPEVVIDIGVDISARITPESRSNLGLTEESAIFAGLKASSILYIPD
ncbi:MAG TPA: ABC transporter ATP-binding protein [Bacteroidales bacterium]|nr:ABC transporter ATP-binding protein [Bacteroidales bacterium]HPS74736.1 ABC transporter ATP-binding protein [Bacteroidales bacterium]